ncbi:3-phosphoinositide-dependent protein kinase Serine/threonine protein phosphatase 2A, regulato [Tribonema minus]|uniref:non-specific serine/threonine protein kinase n=1 Tax=Tribonema minus TaxID=303371 RepID=A0A835YLX0_9STRA|nr:3-phosphoinositide-dependent protein kinase Serine/threonine protein phosphatase 2A, regulato [Tribonema minus]
MALAEDAEEVTSKEVEELLNCICDSINASQDQRAQAVAALAALVKTHRIRDVEFTPALYARYFAALEHCCGASLGGAAAAQLRDACAAIARLPEFDAAAAAPHVTAECVRNLLGAFEGGRGEERAFLRDMTHWLYASFPEVRGAIRGRLGGILTGFRHAAAAAAAARRVHVREALEVVGQVVRGMRAHSRTSTRTPASHSVSSPTSRCRRRRAAPPQVPLSAANRALLTRVLLPLHAPNAMYEWRDQIPVLELYHEPLVYALAQFVAHDASLMVSVLDAVIDAWPEGFHSNTPKEVLLLHELETLLRAARAADFAAVVPRLLPRLTHCLALENSRVVERALFMWRDDAFRALLAPHARVAAAPLLAALLRGGATFWNPTVNKMAAHVLQQLEAMDPAAFAAAAEELWGAGRDAPPRVNPDAPMLHATAAAAAADGGGGGGVQHGGVGGGPRPMAAPPPRVLRPSGGAAAAAPRQPGSAAQLALPLTSLRGGMGDWKPGRSGGGGGSGRGGSGRGGSGGAPPVTVTGVAPWAFSQPHAVAVGGGGGSARGGVARAPKRPLSPLLAEGKGAMAEEDEEEGEKDADAGPERKGSAEAETDARCIAETEEKGAEEESGGDAAQIGLRRVHAFMKRLQPQEEGSAGAAADAWHAAQLEPTPTLLPSLRFHDLVFGQELGRGTFSTVRYARRIVPGAPRARWPEFAVKHIGAAALRAHRYAAAARNEVAALRLLAHPGVARLVSAFRWRGGAYLVLEYAPRGDLHSHIVAHGSLDEVSARFVAAEALAALSAVHDAGFVYGDLKPENVVITRAGHVKLTDFGAARPATAEARRRLRASRAALRELRDGDWRTAAGVAPSADASAPIVAAGDEEEGGEGDGGDEDADDDAAGDDRVEGTAAYFAPEVAAHDSCGGRTPKHASTSLARLSPSCPAADADDEAANDERVFTLNADDEAANDERVEGTAAYLAPEVARGASRPSFLSDAWALGCLLYHCLSGRPPVVEDTDAEAMAAVVRFAEGGGGGGAALPAGTSPAAVALVAALMEPDVSKRLSVVAAARHAFFAEAGVDPYAAHRMAPVELQGGAVAPAPKAAAWTRRQNSMIWAPMPQEYELQQSPSKDLGPIAETEVELNARWYENPLGRISEASGVPEVPALPPWI